MPTFEYTAKNQDSKNVAGKITADNKNAVIGELRKRNLTIVNLKEVKEKKSSQKSFLRKKIKADEIVIFTRQLATMVDAGIPIIQGIDALRDQVVHPEFKRVLTSIQEDIQHGSGLSAAFSKHPHVFDTLFVSMIKVGESGGVLSAVLERVSNYLEKSIKLTRKVKSALIYPAVVVSMAIIISIVLLVKVVPTFAGIYDSFGAELPFMTQMLISVSNGLSKYLPVFVGLIILSVFLLKRWHKTDKGARTIDAIILKIPLFGDLIRKVAVSRFSRTLATLLQSGVPILESLDIVEKTIGNRVLEDVIKNVMTNVREGESIATPLERSSVFPTMVTRMIAIGEKSGQMEKMLLKVSEFYDDQVDAAVEGLTSIIEPLIIGVLGVVIGFIVIALFMPILNITQIV